jgi:hypothetical protein
MQNFRVKLDMTFRLPLPPPGRIPLKLFLCGSVIFTGTAGANEAFIDDAINELGFEFSQKVDLESGKIISVGLPDIERQPTELTVGAAMMLVRRPLANVSRVLVGDDTFRVNTEILDFGAIGDGRANREEIDRVFGRVGYSETESEEVKRLLEAKPGDRFNLSAEEIETFRSLQVAGDDARERVSGALAGMLRKRFTDYAGGGLAAVEPYARKGRKKASPRQELETAFASLKLLEKHFPTFYASLSGFPARLPADTESRFYWIKRLADERPAFVLAHRMAELMDDYTAAMELQFYVQHSYNSMLTLLACVPVEGGTLVLSAIRVYTDQVTGFASGMKKEIGRERVAAAMTEYFREMREVLESQ